MIFWYKSFEKNDSCISLYASHQKYRCTSLIYQITFLFLLSFFSCSRVYCCKWNFLRENSWWCAIGQNMFIRMRNKVWKIVFTPILFSILLYRTELQDIDMFCLVLNCTALSCDVLCQNKMFKDVSYHVVLFSIELHEIERSNKSYMDLRPTHSTI